MTRAVLLVPWRPDGGRRDRSWAWSRSRWRELHPGIPVYEGRDDPPRPFSRAAALNDAARLADADGRWDVGVVIDADIFIDPANVRAAIARAGETGRVTWAFQRWNGLTRRATERLLTTSPSSAGRPGVGQITDADLVAQTPISWSCCFAVPRATWDEVGGFDERFRGWGWEDMAFMSVVTGLYGHERLDGDLFHLWHPRADERVKRGSPLHPAYVANRMLGRRYMYALRVLGMHDRATPSDAAEMERDRANVRNLAAAEELDRTGNPLPGFPDWRDYWPTLTELRDDAKAGTRPGPPQPARVALIMRSGGTLDTWPVRSAYLRRSLASIDRHLGGAELVARVLWSDWPPDVADELAGIATAHGFYVVGSTHRGFTPATARLWHHLATRTWAFDYAFLTEDDFELERDVDLGPMIAALERDPTLVQVALMRDAFYAAERERGGILGHPREEFADVERNGSRWLEHRRFFTLNPTLVRRSLFERAWPVADHSEAVFGRRLFAADPTARAALWGAGEPWIRHIGEVRAGAGY